MNLQILATERRQVSEFFSLRAGLVGLVSWGGKGRLSEKIRHRQHRSFHIGITSARIL